MAVLQVLLWLWSRLETLSKCFKPKFDDKQRHVQGGFRIRNKQRIKIQNQRDGPRLEWERDTEICLEPQPMGKALSVVEMMLKLIDWLKRLMQ